MRTDHHARGREDELRDMLAAIHYEVLAFPRRDGSPLDMAMKRIEREFGADSDFAKRFG